MAYIKNLSLWAFFFLVTPLFVLIALIALLIRGADAAHSIHLNWCRFLVKSVGIRVHTIQSENLLTEPPVIYVSNHQSLLDIIILGAALGTQYRWTARAGLFRIPLLGWGMRRTGYIAINRGHSAEARSAYYQVARGIQAGASIILFPEGTRTRNGRMQTFKNGAALIALNAGVPIQPITIRGAYNLLPVQPGQWMQRYYPGAVEVIIHPPLMPADYANLKATDLSATLARTIRRPLTDDDEVESQPIE